MKNDTGLPESRFDRVDAMVLKISRWISYIVGAVILIIMVVAVINVLVSKIFKSSIPSSTEWITYLNILAVFPAVAFVQLSRGHTRVDILDNQLPTIVKKIVETFGNLLGMAVCFLIGWRTFILFQQHLAQGTMSSSSALTKGAFPLWPFSLALSVFCFIWMLSFGWSIVRTIAHSRNRESAPAAQEEGADDHE